MYLPITLVFFVLSSATAFAPSTHSFARRRATALSGAADIAQLKADMAGGKTFLLDVREPDEWNLGHLALASPAPLSELTAGTWMNSATGEFLPGTFPTDRSTGVAIIMKKKIYIHCKSGGRAKKAAELLVTMGYSKVVALDEGFDELAELGVCDVMAGAAMELTD